MSRILKIILVLVLCVIAILAFAYAPLMVAPGPLIAEHQTLNGDCFACHTAFRGVDSAKCVSCHQTSSIGRLTSKGLPIAGGILAMHWLKPDRSFVCKQA